MAMSSLTYILVWLRFEIHCIYLIFGMWVYNDKLQIKFTFRSGPMILMILRWFPSKFVSGISDLRPRWPPQPNLI
jgi:hypothetical protein